MFDELFDDPSNSDSGIDHNFSCMSANASDHASDSDSIEIPIVSNFEDFFSDSLYSLSDSCEALDDDGDDVDDSPDVPQVSGSFFFVLVFAMVWNESDFIFIFF